MTEKEVQARTIALCGNPNVGKSTVFNALTGQKQHTGNWAGKTVALQKGECIRDGIRYNIVDLPGTYSLDTLSEEEAVARDFLTGGSIDVCVVVCDATCLERNLHLLFQTMEKHSCVVLCVNMMDEAAKRNISVDTALLEKILGIPVVGISARNGNISAKVLDAAERAAAAPRQHHSGIIGDIITDRDTLTSDGTDPREAFALSSYMHASDTCEKCIKDSAKKRSAWQTFADKMFCKRVLFLPIMLSLLSVVLFLTLYGANYPSSLLSELFSFVGSKLLVFCEACKVPEIIYLPLINGVYEVTATVISVMLPPMAIFFPLFTLLEDFGLLPRIAFGLDKTFMKCGTCGKQALSMCVGDTHL